MSPQSATLDPAAALDNSIGAMLIGVIVSAVLHGITLLQAFMYWRNYRKDAWYLKAMVITTVCFDAIHLVLISAAVYHYVITHYHNSDDLRFLTWPVLIEALFTGVNGGIVQAFYTMRVWHLNRRSYWLPGIILLFIFSTAGCGTAWVIISMQFQTYEQLLSISPLTITINALSTFVDVTIAVSLVYLLNQARTGFKKSDTIINKLIVFVVNTGVLTTCCAIAALICLVASPNSLLYASFYFCIGRLYTNSFLATLNARTSFQSNFDDSHMMMSMPSSVVSPHATQHLGTKGRNITIRVDTATSKNDQSQDHKESIVAAEMRDGNSDFDVDEEGPRQKGHMF
ncbi:hypothetical protein HYPSUDRAFT_194341 [Hypholoma sublateritium FD-334 SS-4]|uniref:DUF6534 domain-containing protein n=1 Tax=Hypholoma sublateritium (strain FD-334 SS-4) TaxID=945553 RepID=A0A0D2LX05_HYPSF|nr:hypothetical protein HYPSUDRAFT_194341 [Hypholoma sublateritium FD-334 SS-4]